MTLFLSIPGIIIVMVGHKIVEDEQLPEKINSTKEDDLLLHETTTAQSGKLLNTQPVHPNLSVKSASNTIILLVNVGVGSIKIMTPSLKFELSSCLS